MDFKKNWILGIIAFILILIGWFLPYARDCSMDVCYRIWMWGLYSFPPPYGTGIRLDGDFLMIFILAIIIIILAILSLIVCFFIKKREDKKLFGSIELVLGLIILILVIIPPLLSLIFTVYPVYAGFYLILIGAIVQIVTGVIVFIEK